ncbi:replication initiation protein [Streptococcus suis]|uniref:replication initiation protein n=1 Tax=Streptococcus suis TaxID=1307 RepID=UPI000CF602D5|nr:replication initiation protein [Streptococcus suis]
MENGYKISKKVERLLSRQDYLIVQHNDLAKAFGNLKAFEHKLLDFCFSFVTQDSQVDELFVLDITDVLKHYGLTKNGQNYKRVFDAFKTLNENTALYLGKTTDDVVTGLIMTHLFDYISFDLAGKVQFRFSKYAQPYVFNLRKNFYSFHLSELANIKGKYSLILLKLWEANRFKNSRTTLINGSLDEWQDWFIGKGNRWTASRFKQKAIIPAVEEIESKLNATVVLHVVKDGRTVVGYEMEIIDKRQPNMAYFEQQQKELDKQREEEMRMNRIFDTNEDGGIFGVSETQMDIYDILKELE